MIIAVDFDKTIVTYNKNNYPKVGNLIDKCLDTLKELQANGNKLVLNTNREGIGLKLAELFLEKNNFKFDEVANNKKYKKINADIFIDDKNLGTPLDSNGYVDWTEMRKLLKDRNLINEI